MVNFFKRIYRGNIIYAIALIVLGLVFAVWPADSRSGVHPAQRYHEFLPDSFAGIAALSLLVDRYDYLDSDHYALCAGHDKTGKDRGYRLYHNRSEYDL